MRPSSSPDTIFKQMGVAYYFSALLPDLDYLFTRVVIRTVRVTLTLTQGLDTVVVLLITRDAITHVVLEVFKWRYLSCCPFGN